jgi:hypothetical protein
MKTSLNRLALLLPSLFLFSCASADTTGGLAPVSRIPAGVSKEGTLANTKLVEDATNALFAKLQIAKDEQPKVKIMKFVIQQPVGSIGKKAWREMWILMKDGKAGHNYIMTFQEDGAGSADFKIDGKTG